MDFNHERFVLHLLSDNIGQLISKARIEITGGAQDHHHICWDQVRRRYAHQLDQLAGQFEHWRQNRSHPSERTPKALWDQASTLALVLPHTRVDV